MFQDRSAHAFQGLSGEVEIYGLAERLSGRYAVVLREIQTDDEVNFAGVFDGIPVEPLPADMCAAMKEALAAADSGGATRERPQ